MTAFVLPIAIDLACYVASVPSGAWQHAPRLFGKPTELCLNAMCSRLRICIRKLRLDRLCGGRGAATALAAGYRDCPR